MEEQSIEEIAAEDRREMYRLNEISHIAHNVHNERDRCIISVSRQIAMNLDPLAEPFVQRAGLLPIARLTERWFKIDEPLISAFIEKWRPKTHSFHMLWGECTLTLEQLFEIVQSADPGPTADFIQWWILATRRYLVPADRFYHLPPDEIPDVTHVPDNRQPGRRRMVRTRTTVRDWQWLDDIMAEDAPAAPPTQKIRRMPESYARRRGAGRPRRGGRAGRGRVEGVTRRLPSRLRVVPAPVRR
ncbi:hypothetical protein PIB30_037951 [Stylosanthes scabra]|uniref:Aminotransferase-like plant mobile domain-containing protein n=1 Tax=Stylosanthes scabra TaxID=79078 RepID=A0ABU6VCN1_9FABA|nr:hypothetical protein [Stylosanthes scabra]